VAGLVCAVFFAVFTIAMRAEKRGDAVPAVLLGGVYASIASGIAATVAGQPLVLAPIDAAIAVALGAGSLGFGLILYTLASRHVPAAESTLLAMTEVVLSPIWVWLIFGETAGPLMLVGGGILLAALFGNAIIGVIRERRMARADERSAHVGQRHGNGHHAAPHPGRPVHPGLAGARPVRYPAEGPAVQDRSFRR
jgi:drug/metabolite transporter (DMT)-like permease